MRRDPARWKRVQEVFAAALDLQPPDRAALLERECASDDALRREVASLLVAHDRTGAVDRLALEVLAPVGDGVRSLPEIEPGQVVSHYVVLDRLGVGGMGVVYRARDEHLDRNIALKFLSPDLVANASAKRRFLLEARTAAALEHPNICTVYEIGETPEGHLFIAMPFYEGETLMTRIGRGPLPVDQATWIAREMASGLAAAHQHGIVHRDVKPSNVMLLPDGRLKILDFGVAKVKDVNITGTGTPVGTIAYMSPEQTRGEEVDHRTDIWALGVVLYEMLTGRRPFVGNTPAAVMHAISARPHVPPSQLRERLPPEFDDVVGMCLAKAADRRFATIQDVVSTLDLAKGGTRTARPADSRSTTDTIPLDDSSAAPSAERRRATVLVTAISDYQTLLERLGPSDLEDAVALVRATAADTIRRHGGTVNEETAEEVIALFGIPTAYEDDDLRAVRAAMELHARIRGLAKDGQRRAGPALAVQTGIDSGSVVVQRMREGPRRYGVSGTPSQVAARLASHAEAGAILIGPGCQRLVEPFVATEATRAIELRPNAPPVIPHRVVGESGVQTRLEASDPTALAPFTGRTTELSSLETAVREAAAGSGRVLLVAGEAGMGKSRIIHELRERVRSTGVRVLLGRCRSYGGVSPYLPIVEFLRDVVDDGRGAGPATGGSDDADLLASSIRAIDASLEPFIPLYLHLLSARSDAYPVPRHLQGENLHAALVDAVVAIVMTAAQKSPLLLLLEDWHWADAASREVLQRLAEVVDSLPIAIVVATRPEPSILAELGSVGTIVQLAALERSATSALMTALLGAERINDALVAGVHDRAAGNPFFIEQVVHTLKEEEALVTRGGETTLTRDIESLRLPDTVQAVIRARLDRLDGDSREVLKVASVIGREFARSTLLAAVPKEIDTARALERLRTAALIQQVRVVPEPVYRFKHVLTQEVAYGSLLEHQRKAAHDAIGLALERAAVGHIDEHAETLAHHFGQAESWDQAVKYGGRAAERLSALSQYANALAMFERLQAWLSHLPEDEQRRETMADILLEQERLCETLGKRQRQQQIINELISMLAPHGASSRLAEAYVRQGDLLTLLKRFDAADRALNTVLRLSRDSGDRVLERNALRSLGLLRWHQDRHEDALAIAEGTLEINRALGDELGVAGDLSNIGNILRGMGENARARVVFEEALALPAMERDPGLKSSILHNLALVHRAEGSLDVALDYLQRADDLKRDNLLPLGRAMHLTTIAHIHLQRGDTERALHVYRQAVDQSRRSRHADGLAQSLRLLGELQFGLQHDADAAANLSEAAALFAQLEDRAAEAQALTNVAIVRERQNDGTAARAAWADVRRLRQAMGDRNGELDAVEGFARATRRDQPRDAAIAAFEEALAVATALADHTREAAIHNTLGILEWERGRYLDALGHYESGLRLCRSAGDRPHEALMLNSMGVTLARLQRHEEARTVLEESVALTREIGERLLEAHALTALGDVSLHLGRPETARECHEAAGAIRERLRN